MRLPGWERPSPRSATRCAGLEERLDLRLLTRTTRKVSPTEAGERLAESLRPAFAEIQERLESLDELRDTPAGSIRITSPRLVGRSILLPVVNDLLARYPELHIEISIDSRLVDIVAERYDAGVRLGKSVARDMIAVRIGPELEHGRRRLLPPTSRVARGAGARRTISLATTASTSG